MAASFFSVGRRQDRGRQPRGPAAGKSIRESTYLERNRQWPCLERAHACLKQVLQIASHLSLIFLCRHSWVSAYVRI